MLKATILQTEKPITLILHRGTPTETCLCVSDLINCKAPTPNNHTVSVCNSIYNLVTFLIWKGTQLSQPHPCFTELVLTGIDDSLLHLSVDQYKIKLPFGPICHHLAVHSASSNYCNSWSFKKKIPKGWTSNTCFSTLILLVKCHSSTETSDCQQSYTGQGKCLSQLPSLLCPFSPGGMLQQSRIT